jgi:hypothetical protein
MLRLEFSVRTPFSEFYMNLSHAVKVATDGHCSKWYYKHIRPCRLHQEVGKRAVILNTKYSIFYAPNRTSLNFLEIPSLVDTLLLCNNSIINRWSMRNPAFRCLSLNLFLKHKLSSTSTPHTWSLQYFSYFLSIYCPSWERIYSSS